MLTVCIGAAAFLCYQAWLALSGSPRVFRQSGAFGDCRRPFCALSGSSLTEMSGYCTFMITRREAVVL